MSISLTMPRLSDTMEAGTVIRWNVKEGDKVKSGDVVADIETDKATMEMQCFDDGTVARLLVEPGKQVKVGTPIALIAEKGEDPAQVKAPDESAAADAAATEPAVARSEAPTGEPARTSSGAPATPSRSAVEHEDDEHDSDEPSHARQRVSPVARRIAEERGIDLDRLRGSGPGGRIIKRDVLAAADGHTEPARRAEPRAAAVTSIAPGAPLALSRKDQALLPIAGRSVALSGMRQTIARRLVESKQSIPHYQVTMRFAMDTLLDERKRLNEQLEQYGVKLSVNDFLVRACALAMARHPYFNASFAGDHIEVHGEVNVGIAISLPEERGGGLVVGVIRQADQKSLRQISLEAKYLSEKARSKGLSAEELSGATFTISNLGMFGVEHFTAIINPPNSAILACGAAIEQPVVRDHQLAVGWEMQATLSLDHRVIDGAMAAEYLKTLRELIERPAALLV